MHAPSLLGPSRFENEGCKKVNRSPYHWVQQTQRKPNSTVCEVPAETHNCLAYCCQIRWGTYALPRNEPILLITFWQRRSRARNLLTSNLSRSKSYFFYIFTIRSYFIVFLAVPLPQALLFSHRILYCRATVSQNMFSNVAAFIQWIVYAFRKEYSGR